ncbi:MAG TPA: hypothetical protein EYP32_00460 [Aquificaceae bacterium]|nr:hypothetical protein [Aquificaceae bacterium]
MAAVMKLTEDTPLTSLFEFIPESKELLMEYGLKKIIDDGVYDIIVPRLTLKGFMNLMNLSEKKREELWSKLEELYNKKITEAK